jgi:hypothetical protein
MFQHLALVECPLDGQVQFFVDERLGEKVEGPEADGLDGRLDRAVAGDHDDGGGGLFLAAIGQHVEAVVGAEADVHQHQVVGLPVDGRVGLDQGGRGVGVVALLAQPIGHRGEDLPIVIHQKKRAAGLHRRTLCSLCGRELAKPIAPLCDV